MWSLQFAQVSRGFYPRAVCGVGDLLYISAPGLYDNRPNSLQWFSYILLSIVERGTPKASI